MRKKAKKRLFLGIFIPVGLFATIVILTPILFIVYAYTHGIKVKTDIADYQFIYTIANEFSEDSLEDILDFGKFNYNSYLLLVPRETPSTLQKFYYRWEAGMDTDTYEFYFECKLEKDNYDNYVDGLNSFSVTIDENENQLMKIDGLFDYPTYVVQWWDSGTKWERYEYIMLDDVNQIVIYVFSMSANYRNVYKQISKCTQYNIIPKKEEGQIQKGTTFSIYGNGNSGSKYKLADLKYDISFLDYLL